MADKVNKWEGDTDTNGCDRSAYSAGADFQKSGTNTMVTVTEDWIYPKESEGM